MPSVFCPLPGRHILQGRTNFFIKQLVIKSKLPMLPALLFPCIFFILLPMISFFCLATLQQTPISTESRLPTQMSLTHAPYVPHFIHVAPGAHIFLQVPSAGLWDTSSGILNSPSISTEADTTPFPAHSTQPAIIKQTGLFVTSWFTHQQVIFPDFAMDGFALLTLNKNSSPKNAE